MKVLFVSSEVAPIIKTGGLADVSAALPVALRELGADIRILVPGYPQVLQALPKLQLSFDLDKFSGSILKSFPASRLLRTKLSSGVPIYVLDCPELFQRGGGPYLDEQGLDWADNAQRFGLFSCVAALLGSADSPISWKPNIVHCNDWQSGLTPVYLQYMRKPARTVMTIHNLAFQGNFPQETVPEMGLPWECYKPEGVEFYGKLSFLKAGLYYADHITTVSPTYAKEIQTESLGFGMQGLLAHRSNNLSGILNGIDTVEWDPATDRYLAQTYDEKSLSRKAANKQELQQRLNLKLDAKIPLFGLVSRFAHQKGLDVVLAAAEEIIKLPAQLVIVGSGDAEMQRIALALMHRHPGKIAVYVGFDESLAHQVEAGADIFLMPSRFEPCGLNQLYSQRYATPPLVHATGGLVDTVIDCNDESFANGSASGFVFSKMTEASFLMTISRAVNVYKEPKRWKALQLNCMRKDFSWRVSASAYFDIYSKLIA
jgi:starch synthase